MTVWKKCRMDSFYYDRAAIIRDCEVKIDDSSIVVTYKTEDGWVNYSGRNAGTGHFELKCDVYDGHASLHRFLESVFLEGYWVENGEKGMWRIELEHE